MGVLRKNSPSWERCKKTINRFKAIHSQSNNPYTIPLEPCNKPIVVCIRKCPLCVNSTDEDDDLDIVTVVNPKSCAIHRIKIKLNSQLYVDTTLHKFDFVFCENCPNLAIYKNVLLTLLENSLNGNHSMCFAYGETGSGKTHTMCFTAADKGDSKKNDEHQLHCQESIFYLSGAEMIERLKASGKVLKCRIYELYMNKIYDLLNNRNELTLVEGRDGLDKLRGVRDIDLEDNKQLEKILIQSIRCRKVGKTWANNISSRSHMIIDLMITKPGENKMHGKLCLIDLAGNERCCDSTYFGELTKREMSDINTSLMYLNECIRKMAVSTSCNRQKMKTNHISFRGCLLTRIHRDSFMRDNTRIAMIATVSPGYKHEHAIVNTLLYAQQLSTVNANVISESIQSASSISRARINSEMTKGKIFKFKKKYRNLVGNKLIQGDHARKLIRSNNQLYRAIAGNEDNGSDITLSSESTGSDNFSGCCRKLKKTITTIENIKSNSGEQGHKETIKSINTLLDTCQKQLYQIKEKVKTNFN